MVFDDTLNVRHTPPEQAEIEAFSDPSDATISADPFDMENAQREVAGLPSIPTTDPNIAREILKLCEEIFKLINNAQNHSIIPYSDHINPFVSYGDQGHLYQKLIDLRANPDQLQAVKQGYLKTRNKSIYSDVHDNFQKNGVLSSNKLATELALTELEEILTITPEERVPLISKVMRLDAFDITKNVSPAMRESHSQMLRRMLIKGDGSLSASTPPDFIDYIPEVEQNYESQFNDSFSARLMAVDPLVAIQLQYGIRFPIGKQPSLKEYHATRNTMSENGPNDQPMEVNAAQGVIKGINLFSQGINDYLNPIDSLDIPLIDPQIVTSESFTRTAPKEQPE